MFASTPASCATTCAHGIFSFRFAFRGFVRPPCPKPCGRDWSFLIAFHFFCLRQRTATRSLLAPGTQSSYPFILSVLGSRLELCSRFGSAFILSRPRPVFRFSNLRCHLALSPSSFSHFSRSFQRLPIVLVLLQPFSGASISLWLTTRFS